MPQLEISPLCNRVGLSPVSLSLASLPPFCDIARVPGLPVYYESACAPGSLDGPEDFAFSLSRLVRAVSITRMSNYLLEFLHLLSPPPLDFGWTPWILTGKYSPHKDCAPAPKWSTSSSRDGCSHSPSGFSYAYEMFCVPPTDNGQCVLDPHVSST